MMMIASTTALAKESRVIEHARKILSRFTLAELRGATLKLYREPDITNPGGYFHRWVVLEHRTFFGLFKRETTLYFERSAFGELEQTQVYLHVESLLNALKAFWAD